MSEPVTKSYFEAVFLKLMDPSKLMGQFKIPSCNMEAWTEMQRKNVETIGIINQAVTENLRLFAHRQVAFMEQGIEETTNFMNTLNSVATPQEKIVHQVEISKDMVDKCIVNSRDSAEMLSKCYSDAVDTINNRIADGVKEFQGIIKPTIAA
jgi:phasin family protein